ncbi:putative sulfate exporter family transporter [Actinosynnema pretiosum subsp. pretiosum]|uniref:Sulfate exporter family transporter n=1 Tax=Actinosynnema pretiosum subsp. pretiosum TaxID=103721 RepID=A0AA45R3A4_9PSEU|nr:putative sulfate exporter family transporter [Actinosynnema pretiosum subsp. pretiosum]
MSGQERAVERTAEPGERSPLGLAVLGALVVLALSAAARHLSKTVPDATEGTSWEGVGAAVEFPVYAIALGLLGNALLGALGVRDRLAGGFRTEFFIKTGLVLLGASINLAVLADAAGPALVQSVVLISLVFGFSWWLGGRLGLDEKLRALLSAAVAICGVSAAIAAAGAVQAKREQLAYSASLVIVFALPSIFLLPLAATALGLDPRTTGAWIGGNIDTTAAVTAAGTLAGEESLQVATIVKVTQNALLGVVAVALTAYFALRVEGARDDRQAPDDSANRLSGSTGPRFGGRWSRTAAQFGQRFPKFVLGFLAASAIATAYLATADPASGKAAIGVVNDLRTWFLILAFTSIGLEFRVGALRQAGWRPIGVFAASTAVNVLAALGLAVALF